MAKFTNSANNSVEELGLLHGMGLDSISMPSKRHLKELSRPPVELFASSSGIFIPPEETQPEVSLDDLAGWGFTDDDQIDTDDEDIDGNEFDTDFAEADFPPPVELMEQDPYQQDPYKPSFPPMAAPAHESAPNNTAYPSFPSSAFMYRPLGTTPLYNSPGMPLGFVDPGTLQSPTNGPRIFNENSNPDAVTMQPPPSAMALPELNNASSHINLAPHIQDPKQLEIGLGDLDMDIEMDDLYAPIVDELTRNEQANQQEADGSMTPPPAAEVGEEQPQFSNNRASPVAAEPVQSPAAAPAPPKEEAGGGSPAEEAERDGRPSLGEAPSSPVAFPAIEKQMPSPPLSPSAAVEKPRRKPAVRRKSTRVSHNSSHAGAHVCTMKYNDGSDCNRSFTRPYDLARHQETLHAAVRKTYTCEACGSNSKTFSRLDALSRHMRLKHS